MSLERTMNDLEQHIDYASSFFGDLRHKIEIELKDLNEEIAELADEIAELESEAEEKDTKLQELMYENSMLQLELMEVAGQLIHMRHELDLSRKRV
jgi:predicted nuclease with TOPRIM domain